jgi:hypothetical protein
MRQAKETKDMIEPQKESEIVLLQMKETLNDHRNINLSEVLKEKEYIETRIGYFDIDCVGMLTRRVCLSLMERTTTTMTNR